MITGDAVLTAIHVAREVNLMKQSKKKSDIGLLQLNTSTNQPEWLKVSDDSVIPFTIESITELDGLGFTLATTGALLPHIPPESMHFFKIFDWI